MRKAIVLVLAMLMALVGMSVAAAADVTPLIAGGELNAYVPFSDGFTGFCIDRSKTGAQKDMVFVAEGLNIGEDSNEIGFEEYLKTMFVVFHDDVFSQYGTGGYYHPYHASPSSLMLLKAVYGLLDHEGYEASRNASDDYYGAKARYLVDLVYNYVNKSSYTSPGNSITLDDGTLAEFEFEALAPKNSAEKETHQRFFAYKVQYTRKINAKENENVVLDASINPYAQNSVEKPYVWKKVGTDGNLEEVTGVLELKNVKAGDAGRYLCVVTDEMNTQTNYYFDLTVQTKCVPPVITSPEKDDTYTFADGANVKLCVTATGTDLTYKWSVKNPSGESFTDISGANAAEYEVGNVTGSDTGKVYRCTVTNTCGTATRDFTLNVPKKCVPPVINDLTANDMSVSEDGNYTVEADAAVNMCVNATGEGLTYQWSVKKAGEDTYTDIDGATGETYKLEKATAADSGNVYRCTVTNTCGTATREFALSVTEEDEDVPPAFVSPSGMMEVPFMPGDDVTMTMPSEDSKSVRFAWYVMAGDGESILIDGEDGDIFIIEKCASENDGAVLVCVAEDENGNTSSLAFKLVQVGEALLTPEIISPAGDYEIAYVEGENVTLSIVARNADAYQWYVDKGNGELEEIPGANESSYTISGVSAQQDGWVYACGASNDNVGVLSPVFIMKLASAPVMPQTGDDSALFVWIGMMLCAMASGMMLRRRKCMR